MNSLLKRWLQFWIIYILLFIITYIINKQIFLIFIGPLGIINGYLISYYLEQYKREWDNEGISKRIIRVYCIPYYLYYVCTIAGCVWFFMRIL